MIKRFLRWTITAVFICLPAIAQQVQSRDLALQHLAPGSMSAADRGLLERRHSDLVAAAQIYGYDLAAGNWTYEETLCAPIPDSILLHYMREFPDGTESLFTALVPRSAGHVRVVPVLYRSTTPFVPAPRDPRNYALFNQIVSNTIAGRASSGKRWIELSACYAEMTGGRIDLAAATDGKIGIAGAPSATVHLDLDGRADRVTFASRESAGSYKIWTVALNGQGRVAAASTEDYSVAALKAASQQPSPGAATAEQPSEHPQTQNPKPTTIPTQQTENATIAATPATPGSSAAQKIEQASDEPGWKLVLNASEPPSKVLSSAPPPPEKVMPEPPQPASTPD